MARKELTKTALVAAHDEIDKIVGIVPPLKETLKQDKYEKDLYTTITNDLELSTAEIKEFSKKTQEVIKALKEKFASADDEDEDVDEVDEDDEQEVEVEEEDEEEEEEEIPAPPVKKGKTPVVVIEEDEDEDEEDDEELSIVDQVLTCKKKTDYIELINDSPEFKKDKKRLLAISSVFSLKKEMLAVVSPAKKKPVVVDDDDDEEEAEEIKHVKKTAPVEKVKKEKKEKVVKEKSERGSGSMLVRELVCKNPKITNTEIEKELAKAGFEQSPISINIRKMEMIHAINMIRKFGLPK